MPQGTAFGCWLPLRDWRAGVRHCLRRAARLEEQRRIARSGQSRLLQVARSRRRGAGGRRSTGSVRLVHSLVTMRDEDITGVAGFWAAAARNVDRNFPHDGVVRALSSLPDVGIWAISEDSSALFALLRDEVVFTVGFRDDGTVRIHSRPLDGQRLLVSLTWGESKPIETGGTAWSTRWAFLYRDEREAHDAWQHITGSVVLDRVRGERLDEREKFARAIASTAGWNARD